MMKERINRPNQKLVQDTIIAINNIGSNNISIELNGGLKQLSSNKQIFQDAKTFNINSLLLILNATKKVIDEFTDSENKIKISLDQLDVYKINSLLTLNKFREECSKYIDSVLDEESEYSLCGDGLIRFTKSPLLIFDTIFSDLEEDSAYFILSNVFLYISVFHNIDNGSKVLKSMETFFYTDGEGITLSQLVQEISPTLFFIITKEYDEVKNYIKNENVKESIEFIKDKYNSLTK